MRSTPARPRYAVPSGGAAVSRPVTPPAGVVNAKSSDASFEDKLKAFMQESDSRMSGNKLYADRRANTRRRK